MKKRTLRIEFLEPRQMLAVAPVKLSIKVYTSVPVNNNLTIVGAPVQLKATIDDNTAELQFHSYAITVTFANAATHESHSFTNGGGGNVVTGSFTPQSSGAWTGTAFVFDTTDMDSDIEVDSFTILSTVIITAPATLFPPFNAQSYTIVGSGTVNFNGGTLPPLMATGTSLVLENGTVNGPLSVNGGTDILGPSLYQQELDVYMGSVSEGANSLGAMNIGNNPSDFLTDPSGTKQQVQQAPQPVIADHPQAPTQQVQQQVSIGSLNSEQEVQIPAYAILNSFATVYDPAATGGTMLHSQADLLAGTGPDLNILQATHHLTGTAFINALSPAITSAGYTVTAGQSQADVVAAAALVGTPTNNFDKWAVYNEAILAFAADNTIKYNGVANSATQDAQTVLSFEHALDSGNTAHSGTIFRDAIIGVSDLQLATAGLTGSAFDAAITSALLADGFHRTAGPNQTAALAAAALVGTGSTQTANNILWDNALTAYLSDNTVSLN